MKFTLKIWRQAGPDKAGKMAEYAIDNIIGDMSFLEMLDCLNETLIKKGEDPVEFDHDCREGICGSCGLVINGQPHGPERGTTTCELYMRHFKNGDTIVIEPWRAAAFPVVRDLVVDRKAFDRIMATGGYISVNTGPHADANAQLIPQDNAEAAMGRGGLHRLRRLRGGLPQRLGLAVHQRQDRAIFAAAAGPARTLEPRPRHGRTDGRRGLRQLHKHRRVQRRLPEKHSADGDRADEVRLPDGAGPHLLPAVLTLGARTSRPQNAHSFKTRPGFLRGASFFHGFCSCKIYTLPRRQTTNL